MEQIFKEHWAKMSQLDDYRREIDKYTDEIVELIATREELCRKIGQYKSAEGLPTYDANRETEIFNRVEKRARELGLDKEDRKFLKDVFRLIMRRSRNIQDS